MDEMNVLNAPKKVVDGLTEVFEGLPRCLKACLISLNFWAQMLPRRISVSSRSWIRKLLLCLRRKVHQHRIHARSRSKDPKGRGGFRQAGGTCH